MFSLGAEQLKLLLNKGLFIDAAARLHAPVTLAPPVRLWACTLSHGTQIDAFSYVSPGAALHGVSVGRYCSIGDGVSILSSHPSDRLTTHPMSYESIFGPPFEVPRGSMLAFEGKLQATHIGHDVWIGSGAKIKTGVRIGNGCIIGAGSVVTKDVKPFSVVGGAPAKIIRTRFDAPTSARIEQVGWWQYNLLGQELPWDDIAACLDRIEQLTSEGALKPYKPQWVRLT